MSLIAMPFLFEGNPQFVVVVYLAIKNNPHRAVFVCDRLVPGTQIDDTQPAHGETHGSVRIISLVVRPTMSELPIHRLQNVQRHVPLGMEIADSTDSAHNYLSLASKVRGFKFSNSL